MESDKTPSHPAGANTDPNNSAASQPPHPTPGRLVAGVAAIARGISVAAGILVILLMVAWAVGALFFSFPFKSLQEPIALLFVLAMACVSVFVRGRFWKAVSILLACAIVLYLSLSPEPRNDRHWQPDVAETPWAEIHGDAVTLHNVRDCDYRSEQDYTARWEVRNIHLSAITGIDLFINYWGSPWAAHPILSFQFADQPPLAFSIEARKEAGEDFNALAALYRKYELIYIVAPEQDVIRVRTNYHKGEDVYLYHTNITPVEARERFLEYLASLNNLRLHPKWYNIITTNCTTSIRLQRPENERASWDWRILVNGKVDEMLYERGLIAGGLPFDELKRRAQINATARVAGDGPDFPAKIRAGLPGFSQTDPL